jgi:hypothetical protein
VLTSAEKAIENTMKMDILRIQEPERKASGRQGPVKIVLRTSEIAMIVIGGIIFLATVVTLVIICNVKHSKYLTREGFTSVFLLCFVVLSTFIVNQLLA